MSHFGHIVADAHTIPHVLAKGIPTNTNKQERDAGLPKSREMRLRLLGQRKGKK